MTALTSLLAKVASGALGLPAPLLDRTLGRLLGPPPRNDRGDVLDVHTHLLVRAERLVHVPADRVPVAQRRRHMIAMSRLGAGPQVSGVDAHDLVIPGAHPLPARLYRAAQDSRESAPAALYFHGGGFVEGGLDSHEGLCRRLAKESGVALLAVDYRKAPEHRFPAAIDDARRAFAWAREHAAELGLDPARMGVAGDSAGGNLAAGVARLDGPSFQVLIYPATDMTRGLPSQRSLGQGFFLDGPTIDHFLGCYLRGPADLRDPLASPLWADDLRGAAPAHVVVAGFDPLRDEGLAYADRLAAAGVATTTQDEVALIHGFASMTGLVPAAREAVSRIAARLSELAHP